MPNHDVICWEDNDGNFILKACSDAGLAWISDFNTVADIANAYVGDFQSALSIIPRTLKIGVLDPMGKIQTFCPGVLH